MSNQLEVIDNALKSKAIIGRLTMALGYNADDEAGKKEAFKYAASVLAEVEKTAGDDKKDLTVCVPHSIAQTMIDAARFRVMIDARQHAHIVKYGKNATLQIGYRGYIAKLKEHYQSYKMEKASPFGDNPEKMVGVFCCIAYTNGDRKIQKITTMSKNEIGKVRKAAKQDFIWAQWFLEKAKVAVIKRACKVHFAAITGLQELIRYDNEHNFQIEKPEQEVKPGGIIDNLNKTILAEADVIDQEPSPTTSANICASCNGKGSVDYLDDRTGETGIEPCSACGGEGKLAA